MSSRFESFAPPDGPVTGKSVAFRIDHPTDVAMVRREAENRAGEHGLDETERGRVALIITELGTNLLKHANGGDIIVSFVTRGALGSVEIIALDCGPGISNLTEAFRDGHSTAGTKGHGLGAISRLSSAYDIYSQAERGTAIFAEVATGRTGSKRTEIVGGLAVPVAGEHDCGDAWHVERRGRKITLAVVDGLGHGTLASDAANEAVRVFRENLESSPADVLHLMHGTLRSSRGAAVAIADLDLDREVIDYAGIGNIAARMIDDERVQSLVSMNGTVGHGIERTAKQFRYPCRAGATLVLYSDGITNHWKLGDYPSLNLRHPSLIAAVIYRDHRRGSDDSTVVVAKVPQL